MNNGESVSTVELLLAPAATQVPMDTPGWSVSNGSSSNSSAHDSIMSKRILQNASSTADTYSHIHPTGKDPDIDSDPNVNIDVDANINIDMGPLLRINVDPNLKMDVDTNMKGSFYDNKLAISKDGDVDRANPRGGAEVIEDFTNSLYSNNEAISKGSGPVTRINGVAEAPSP